MIDRWRRFNKNIFYLGIAILITYIAATWNMKGTQSIAVYGDEFGYWQGAAFFLGIDWSEVVSQNAYYGCGYGIFLAPIMKIWRHDSSSMIQMAIRMQAVLLGICLVIAYNSIGIISDSIRNIPRVLLSAIIIWYPYNFLFVNVTMCESILSFCFWILFYLILKYVYVKKNIYLYMTIPVTVYMYLVHSRGIGAILALFTVWTIAVISLKDKTIEKRKAILVLVLLIFFLIIALQIKNMYINFEYAKAAVEAVDSNNMKGQVSKINRIFGSFSGLKSLFYSLFGKIFYSIVATFYLLPMGLHYCFVHIRDGWKKKELNNKLQYILAAMMFLFALGIGAVVTSSNGGDARADVLIYGRYLEHTFGPIMLLGGINILESKRDNSKILLICIALTQFLAFLIGTLMNEESSLSNIWVNCAAISNLFYIAKNNKEAILLAATISSIFPFIISYLIHKKKDYSNIIILILFMIGIYWCRQSISNWQNQVVEWRDRIFYSQNEILNMIDTNTFALYDADFAGFFQFLRVDAQVLSFDSIEECSDRNDIKYIISDADCDMKSWIVENAKIIKENNSYILWDIN